MIYTFHDCVLDDQLYQLRRCGEVVPLEPQVFRLLAYLLTHRDRVVSRDELFEKLWPGQVVGDAALTYCVAKARKAVHDTGTQQHVLKTVHGHGYRLIAPVSVLEESCETSSSVMPIPIELPQAHIPLASHTAALPVSAPEERDITVWSSPFGSPRRRQLSLVGCLFVCGWITSLWQVSMHSPWQVSSLQTALYLSQPDVPQAKGKLCPWWPLATQSREALEALRQGWASVDRATPEAKVEARWRFRRAIDIDPTYAAAYASLGWLAWQDWLSWSQDAKSLDEASLYLRKAAVLDSSCPQVHTLLSEVLFAQRRQRQVIAEAERRMPPASGSLPTG